MNIVFTQSPESLSPELWKPIKDQGEYWLDPSASPEKAGKVEESEIIQGWLNLASARSQERILVFGTLPPRLRSVLYRCTSLFPGPLRVPVFEPAGDEWVLTGLYAI